MEVGEAKNFDIDALVRMRARLWPHESQAAHRAELERIVRGDPPGNFPLVCLIVREGHDVMGFAEVGLRSHADGCDPERPCGFLEGWYVDPAFRNRGVGRVLVNAAEVWAREQGAVEMASDTWMDDEESQRAHAALGFQVVDRCVNYRKSLV